MVGADGGATIERSSWDENASPHAHRRQAGPAPRRQPRTCSLVPVGPGRALHLATSPRPPRPGATRWPIRGTTPPGADLVRGHHQAANLFGDVDGPLFGVVTGLVDGAGRVTFEVTDAHRILEGLCRTPWMLWT